MKSLDNFVSAPVIQVAMDEELAPFLEITEPAGDVFSVGVAEYHPRVYRSEACEQNVLLVRSKIGLVNASTAITVALSILDDAPLVISAGTAGGLRQDVNVGDLAVGATYTYTDADATAFGYERGQVPGMPVAYETPADLLATAREAASSYDGDGEILVGQMLAGGSFVTAHNVADTREVFPEAISTDMETTAIAQVCANQQVPFIAMRGISDLCGPAADQDFHLGVEIVGPRSAALSFAVLTAYLNR